MVINSAPASPHGPSRKESFRDARREEAHRRRAPPFPEGDEVGFRPCRQADLYTGTWEGDPLDEVLPRGKWVPEADISAETWRGIENCNDDIEDPGTWPPEWERGSAPDERGERICGRQSVASPYHGKVEGTFWLLHGDWWHPLPAPPDVKGEE
jgi:hypothetical protein